MLRAGLKTSARRVVKGALRITSEELDRRFRAWLSPRLNRHKAVRPDSMRRRSTTRKAARPA
jgi:hypothetical protein